MTIRYILRFLWVTFWSTCAASVLSLFMARDSVLPEDLRGMAVLTLAVLVATLDLLILKRRNRQP